MKRVILGMGVNRPASIESAHPRFDATLEPIQLRNLVLIANKTNNADLINGLVKLVQDDIKYDIDNGKVSKSKILNHYKNHISALQLAEVGDISSLQNIGK